jgi:hypothetical protein
MGKEWEAECLWCFTASSAMMDFGVITQLGISPLLGHPVIGSMFGYLEGNYRNIIDAQCFRKESYLDHFCTPDKGIRWG